LKDSRITVTITGVRDGNSVLLDAIENDEKTETGN
jgi:hypothetical protein